MKLILYGHTKFKDDSVPLNCKSVSVLNIFYETMRYLIQQFMAFFNKTMK